MWSWRVSVLVVSLQHGLASLQQGLPSLQQGFSSVVTLAVILMATARRMIDKKLLGVRRAEENLKNAPPTFL